MWEIYKNWSPWTLPMTFFFTLNQSIFLFLSFESILFVVQLILTQFSNPPFSNSLFWVCWAWVHPPFGLGTQIWSLQLVPSMGSSGVIVSLMFNYGRFRSSPGIIYGVLMSRSLSWSWTKKGLGGECAYYLHY